MPERKSPRADALKPEGDTNYATPALEKGLDVIELLARQPGGLTKSQVARELNRTVSEIFRMLLCLERRGYISETDQDRYSLTLKLFKLVQEHPPTERLITESLPILHRIAHDTLQSCHLAIIEGGQIVILAQVNAPTSTGFYVKLGATVDLLEAASGYVILANMSDTLRQRTIEEWRQRTGGTPPASFAAQMLRIEKHGYERRASYQVRGVVNISFPVFDDRGLAIGAVTVPYIQHNDASASVNDVIGILRKGAAEITAAIGGRPHQRQRAASG